MPPDSRGGARPSVPARSAGALGVGVVVGVGLGGWRLTPGGGAGAPGAEGVAGRGACEGGACGAGAGAGRTRAGAGTRAMGGAGDARPRRAGRATRWLAALPALLLALAAPRGAEAQPVIGTSPGISTYVERSPAYAMFVDPNLIVTSTRPIVSATVVIIEPFEVTVDELTSQVFNGLNRPFAYNMTTRTYTLRNTLGYTATAADYQGVLRTVTFFNQSPTPRIETRVIAFTVTDDLGNQATATKQLNVVLRNNAPEVQLSSATATYTEGAGAQVLDPGVVAADEDSFDFSQVTVQITANYQQGEDVLAFGEDVTQVTAPDGLTLLGLSSTFDVSTGTLTLRGTAQRSEYTRLLRGVTFTNNGLAISTDPRTVSWTLTDIEGLVGTAATQTLVVNGVNQLPVLTMGTYANPATYDEGGSSVVLDSAITVTDADHTTLASATVAVTTGFEVGKDKLAVGGSSGVSASYDDNTGVLTLTGGATLADYQAALRLVTYTNDAEDAATGTRVITFTVTDGAGGSATGTRELVFSTVLDGPQLTGAVSSLTSTATVVTVQPNAVVNDPDSTVLASATVTIGTGCAPGDQLTASNAYPEVVATFAGCTLSMSGAASETTYQAMLRSVRIDVAPDSGVERTVTMTATDDVGRVGNTLSRTFYFTANTILPTVTSATSVSTAGGRTTITGANFGPVSPILVTRVVVNSVLCTNVIVTTADSVLECDVAEGTGSNLVVEMTVSDRRGPVAAVFTYANPVITATTTVDTTGGLVTITGQNFGPAGSTNLLAAAGGRVEIGGQLCSNPTVTVAHTQLTCTAATGTGMNKPVTVTVTGVSGTGPGVFRYNIPTTASFKGSVFGYYTFLTGTNFGPVTGGGPISVTLTPQGGGASISCSPVSVSTANTAINCTLPAAVLTSAADLNTVFDVLVNVDGQTNTDGAGKFQYEGPVITNATMPNLFGGILTISGRNFGPFGTGSSPVLFVGTDSPPKRVDATVASVTGVTSTPGMVARYGQGPVQTYCATRQCVPNVTQADSTLVLYIDDYTQMQTPGVINPQLVVQITTSNGIAISSPAYTNFQYEGPVITGPANLVVSQFGEPGDPANPTLTFNGRNLGSDINFGGARLWSQSGTAAEWFEIDGIRVTDNAGSIISSVQATFTKTPARPGTPKTGQNLAVKVRVNGIEQTSNGIVSYGGPIITSIAGQGALYAGSGTQVMTITGTRFGPRFSDFDYFNTATYPNAKVEVCTSYTCHTRVLCANPQVFTADVQIRCDLPQGVYIETSVFITIYDGSLTALNTGANKLSVSYPTVTAVAKVGGGLPPTTGARIVISGYSFGPVTAIAGTAPIAVTIGVPPVACTNVLITASPAQPINPSTLECDAPAQSGLNNVISLNVTNDGRSLTNAAQGTAANIYSVSGPSITSATASPTAGGTIYITGTNFGLAGTSVSGLANGVAMTNVAVLNHTTIQATNPTAGVGTGYSLVVTVNSQTSATVNQFNYQAPTVTSLSVQPSVFGGTFTVTGTNFGPAGTTAVVTITSGGVTQTATTPTVAGHTSVVATMACATLCHVNPRDVLVTVGGQNSGTTGNGKLVNAGPVITSVADLSMFASSTNQDPLTITGTNLGTATLSPTVQICPKAAINTCFAADYTAATGVAVTVPTGATTANQVTAQIPPNLIANVSVLLTLTQGGVTVTTGTTGQNSFRYTAPTYTTVVDTTITPSVRRVVNQLDTPGGILTITGSGLGPLSTTTTTRVVWLNAILPTAAPQVTVLGTQMQITIPAGIRFVPFSIHMSYNSLQATAVASEVLYFKYNSPTIASCDSVSTAGGRVTIVGTNFGVPGTSNLRLLEFRNTTGPMFPGGNCEVLDTPATPHTRIACDAGAGLGIGHTIRLQLGPTADDSETITSGGVFNYLPPTITGVSYIQTGPMPTWPYVGHDGTNNAWVTITGQNFGPTGPLSNTLIGGAVCLFPRVTVAHTEVQCLLGEGSGQNYDVSFTIGGQATITQNVVTGVNQGSGVGAFRYAAPAVASTNKVNFFGGSTITLTGTNFGCAPGVTGSTTGGACKLPLNGATQAISVTIGGVACANAVVSTPHTTIKCTAPARLDQAVITGIAGQLVVGGQQATFTYDYSAPVVHNMTEASFFGGRVTIYGENFGPVGPFNGTTYFLSYGGTTVYPQAAQTGRRLLQSGFVYPTPEVTVANTAIVFEVPAPVSASVGLSAVLTIRGVASTVPAGVFNFVGPRITSATSPPTSGGVVTISGRNFGPVGTANLNLALVDSLPCTSPSVTALNADSTGEVTCTVGEGSGANLNIFLKLATETDAGTGNGKFSYAPPTISGISPMDQLPGGNITLSGTSFGHQVGQLSVTIGGYACTYVEYLTPHTEVLCTTPIQLGANRSVIVTVNGVASSGDVWSYTAPRVDNATSVNATGGVVTIMGAVFGPVNGSQVTQVKLGNATCAQPNVTDVGVIKCHCPPMGLYEHGGQFAPEDLEVDGKMDVTVFVENQPSGTSGRDKFSFLEPVVMSMTPQLAGGGERVTIGGVNFGEIHQGLVVRMLSLYRGVSYVATSPLSTSVRSPSPLTGLQTFEFEMPPVAGGVSNLMNLTVNGRYPRYDISFRERNVAFKPPVIASLLNGVSPHTSPPTTSGGMVTIAGTNFGPVGAGHLDRVYVYSPLTGKELICGNPNVTVANTRIACFLGPGAGMSLNPHARVSGQDSNGGAGSFAYPKPTVTAVFPNVAFPNSDVFITGTNFGPDDAGLDIVFAGPGDDTCGPISCIISEMVLPHTQVRCRAAINVGNSLDVLVNATNQVNDVSPDAKFSYESIAIKSISRSTTEGSDVTIVGSGFGPVTGTCYNAYFQSIVLSASRNIVCTDPRVVLPNEAIVCKAGEGTGKLHTAQVTMRGTTAADTGTNVFSYHPPNVTEVIPLATRGGTLQVVGENFGPSSLDPSLIQVVVYTPEPVNCTNPRIGSNAHREVLCDFVPGTGAGKDIVVTIDGQSSGDTGLAKFQYARPIVESVEPPVQPRGETSTELTIVGQNFGADVTKLNVTVGGYPADMSTVRLIITEDKGAAAAKEEIRVLAPFAAGEGLPVVVHCDGLRNDMDNSPEARFSYSAPYLTAATPAETQGGTITLTGGNFGPVGIDVHAVTVGGQACANPRVTVDNVEMECEVPRGYGAGLDVVVQISEYDATSSRDTGKGLFRYSCPQILNLVADRGRASEGRTGSTVTIIGRSFGHNVSAMSVRIAYEDGASGARGFWETAGTSGDIVFSFPDLVPDPAGQYRIRAPVPVGFGSDLNVTIAVANQDNMFNCAEPTPNFLSPLKYTYPPPIVRSSTTGPTSGGRVTVTGEHFGPVGSRQVGAVRVYPWREGVGGISCTGGEVTVSNVRLVCNMTAGEGKNLDMELEIGGLSSGRTTTDAARYSYSLPQVVGVNPNVVVTGTRVTVTGSNFGTVGRYVRVTATRPLPTGREAYLTVDGVEMLDNHTRFSFDMPLGSGTGLALQVEVPVDVDATVPTLFAQASPDREDRALFSFAPPEVVSASPVPTGGGRTTIVGRNFGVAGSTGRNAVTSVNVNGKPAYGVNVTVGGTQLEANVAPGVGKGLAVNVAVNYQGSTGGEAAFAYAVPTVFDVLPASALPGTVITVKGANFGDSNELGVVKVFLGDFESRAVSVKEPHFELTCEVPQGKGIAVPVVVEVAGQPSPAANARTFTFVYSGCTDAAAVNFDKFATVDDNTCRIVGCTRSLSPNFNPKANEDDGSCIKEPGNFTIELTLDYRKEYLPQRGFYDGLVSQEIAQALGILKSRVSVVGHREGSTILDMQIADRPNSTAADAVNRFEQLVLTSRFDFSFTVLLKVMVPEQAGVARRDITTKAGEPPVSDASIIGLCVGGGALLLFAVFWKQCMVGCVKACCGPEGERQDVLVEVVAPGAGYGGGAVGGGGGGGYGGGGYYQSGGGRVAPQSGGGLLLNAAGAPAPVSGEQLKLESAEAVAMRR